MKSARIHIMGASGAGVTSLGRALADATAIPHHDTDDYYWQPTIPPYRQVREIPEMRLMRELFLPRADRVLSGSLEGWGDEVVAQLDLVVFLSTPGKFACSACAPARPGTSGTEGVYPGGWRHQETEDFIEWASHYEDGSRGPQMARHQAWLAAQPCPVLRLDGSRPLPQLVAACVTELGRVTLPRRGRTKSGSERCCKPV